MHLATEESVCYILSAFKIVKDVLEMKSNDQYSLLWHGL